MKSKILFITLIVIAIISAFCINYANTENDYVIAFEPTLETETTGGKECLFANGTPITIVAREDGQEGATIKYKVGKVEKTINVSKDASIFGGSHNIDGTLKRCYVEMQGGTVKNIFGGGLHKCIVEDANIVFWGGTITSVNGGGAGSFVKDLDQENYLDNNTTKENLVNITKNVNININKDTTIKSTIFGGGEGISYTGKIQVHIFEGNLETAYITSAGANGITDEAKLFIYGGNLGIVQNINRGTVGRAEIKVRGGKINKLYIGGETEDKNVTAKANFVSADLIYGETNILESGTNNGIEITTIDGKVGCCYEKKAVNTIAESAKNIAIEHIMIKYKNNNESFVVPNTTLNELSQTFKSHTKEGFVGYYEEGTDRKIEINEKLTKSVKIESRFLPGSVVTFGTETDEYWVKPNGTLKDIKGLPDFEREGFIFLGLYNYELDRYMDFDEVINGNMDLYPDYKNADEEIIDVYLQAYAWRDGNWIWGGASSGYTGKRGFSLLEILERIGIDYIAEEIIIFYNNETKEFIDLNKPLMEDTHPIVVHLSDYIKYLADTNQELSLDVNTSVSEETLNVIKESEKTVELTDGIIKWTIEPEKIEDTSLKIKSTKVTLTDTAPERVEKVEELAKELENVKYLNFEHHGKLPGKITVTVDVSNEYKDGQKLIVRHYNETENKLEDEIEVEVKDGKITFEVESLSTYVLSEKVAKIEDTNKEEVKEEPKVEDTIKEEPKVEDTTKEEVKEESKKEDQKDKTPKTGDPIYIVFGILALAISIRIVYAIITKKRKK